MPNGLNFHCLLMLIVVYPDKAEAIGPFNNIVLIIVLVVMLLVSLIVVALCRLLPLSRKEPTESEVSQVERFDENPKAKKHSSIPSNWSETDIRSYLLARTFEQQFPPKNPDITSDEFSLINEKGVEAWEMEKHPYMNVVINDKTELTFLDGDCCVQSNLPFPPWTDVCYFEIKICEKPADTRIAIGATSKPYPSWRFPGLNKHSVGYYSTGHTFCNDSFEGKPYSTSYNEGDIIGCGYRTQSGSVFFTRNGEKMKPAITRFHHGIYPAVAANGPCTLQVNFGQLGFVLVEANVKKWGFGPVLETRPPPAYGITENAQAVESESDYNEDELSFLQIPRRYRNVSQTNMSSRNISRNSLSFLSEFSISIFDDEASQPEIPASEVVPPPPAYSSGRIESETRLPN